MTNNNELNKQFFQEMINTKRKGGFGIMAFTQEDLDALYEKGEPKIIICGGDLHIPLNERKVVYFGINSPTVVVDADEPVDFAELGIEIWGCNFDEKYKEVLAAAASDGTEDSSGEEEYDEADREELQNFYDAMKEYFSDFREELREVVMEGGFQDCFDLEELDPDDYDNMEYDYETRAKAKLACKDAVQQMVDSVRYDIIDGVREYMELTASYYTELCQEFTGFLGDLSDAYDACASLECGEKMYDYVMEQKEGFFGETYLDADAGGVSMDAVEAVVSKDLDRHFPVRTLLKECDFDCDDDDGDKSYCYDIESVCDTINTEAESYLDDLEETLPQRICATYLTVVLQALERMEERFDSIFTE